MKYFKPTLLFLFLVCFFQNAISQTMWKYFTADDFNERRKRVMEKIVDGVVILQGASLPEGYIKFRQDNNFYYLSGVETPDAVMVIDGSTKRSLLWVPDAVYNDIKQEARIKAGDSAAAIYKFDAVMSKTRFTSHLQALANSNRTVYISFTPEEMQEMCRDRSLQQNVRRMNDPWDGRVSKETNFYNKLRERFPTLTIKSISPILDDMRWVKDAKEIAVIRECGRIGCLGIDEAIRVTRPGIYEYQTVAACDFVFANSGASFPAYFPIAASGAQGLDWHYNANNHLLEEGTVLLIDYAPELNYYMTDITRTWPVSGKFTADQQKYYACIREARSSIIAAMKPGVYLKELEEVCKKVYEKHGFAALYPGGIGHFVGMSVHDVGDYTKPFVAGTVFNVEPIIEDKAKKMHLRLEDTIVITATGAENLTPQSPVEEEAIYKLMKEKGVGEQ
jgi:Xaa-Pro aminopeptidase